MSSTLIAGITFSMFAILFYHVSMITCQNAPPPPKKKKMSSFVMLVLIFLLARNLIEYT